MCEGRPRDIIVWFVWCVAFAQYVSIWCFLEDPDDSDPHEDIDGESGAPRGGGVPHSLPFPSCFLLECFVLFFRFCFFVFFFFIKKIALCVVLRSCHDFSGGATLALLYIYIYIYISACICTRITCARILLHVFISYTRLHGTCFRMDKHCKLESAVANALAALGGFGCGKLNRLR